MARMKLVKKAGCWLILLLALSGIAFAILWVLFPFPQDRLNQWPISPMVLDETDRPMLAIVSQEESWRFPVDLDEMSPWLIQATMAVEDKRFYQHAGVDYWAVFRALTQNIHSGRVISGASTLDMQVCRMMDHRQRTLKSKAIESFRALQLNKVLESKDEILSLYLNIAPYGGNIHGVEAAALKYFSKHAKDLNLSEAALIAGLPQSPTRYRPDRHLSEARKRQHHVLDCMFEQGMISSQQRTEAKDSPLEIHSVMFDRRAPHVSWWTLSQRSLGGQTTIDLKIQSVVEQYTGDQLRNLPEDTEVAVVVIDIAQASIKALVGSGDYLDPVDGQVNGAIAKRSPGSALKPFIYAAAFEAGRLAPDSMVYDYPIVRGGWSPENFDGQYHGSVPVSLALQWSLNVPAILVAEAVGMTRCCGVIESVGIGLPSNASTRGGLALAVGGIEVSLFDLTNGYATLGRGGIQRTPRLFADEQSDSVSALDPSVCAAISRCLSIRQRQTVGVNTEVGSHLPWFMWKTGTSSGYRDAWAVGHNGRYAIGVWVGKFKGTGSIRYIGAEAAEPLLVSLFTDPHLRVSSDPPPSESWVVRTPLDLPKEKQKRLFITQPSNNEQFICVHGEAAVHLGANKENGIQWFLNGRLLDSGTKRLSLIPGQYKLRCIDSSTQDLASVNFSVSPHQI